MHLNAENGGPREGRDAPTPTGLSPLDLLAAVLDRWRLLMMTMLLAAIVAGVAAAMRPAQYTARTLLFLAQNQPDPRAAMLSAQAPALLGLGGSNPNAKLVGVILSSRSLEDSLRDRYGQSRSARIQQNSDGSIQVDVSHRDPETAARIANGYAEVVNRLVGEIGAAASEGRQVLLRQELDAARRNLERSEETLVQFQRRENLPEVEEQARRTMEAASDLQRRITGKEVEVLQLRRTATPDNPALRAAEAELAAWRAQLRRLTTGGGGERLFVPLGESPGLKVDVARLLRDYGRDEQVFVALTAALAQAQIDINRSLPVVSVIDPALPPERPSGPGLPVVVVLAATLGLLAGGGWVVAREIATRAREQPRNDRFFGTWDRLTGSARAGAVRVPVAPRD